MTRNGGKKVETDARKRDDRRMRGRVRLERESLNSRRECGEENKRESVQKIESVSARYYHRDVQDAFRDTKERERSRER